MQDAIKVTELTFGYVDVPVLDNLFFRAKKGETVAITGANGTGKTTFLRLLLGLLKPWGGSISVLGKPLRTEQDRMFARKNIAYVPQERLAGKMPIKVKDAVLFGRYAVSFRGLKKPSSEDRFLVQTALDKVGLSHISNASVNTLSGGQLQRMAIARGFVRKAPILILDEPTAHLDRLAKDEIPHLLEKIHNEREMTLIVITHENIDMDFHHKFRLEDGIFKEVNI